MGKFLNQPRTEEEEGKVGAAPARAPRPAKSAPPAVCSYLAEQTCKGEFSLHKGKCPAKMSSKNVQVTGSKSTKSTEINAKAILDKDGPEAMCKWVREQSQILLTD